MAAAESITGGRPATASGRAVRCPICLAGITCPAGTGETTVLRCPRCGRKFKLSSALPPAGQRLKDPATGRTTTGASLDASLNPSPDLDRFPIALMLAAALAVAISVTAASMIGRPMRGPAFLGLYLVTFAATFGAATLLRHAWRDTWVLSVAGFVAFEMIGLIRMADGLSRGMHKFQFLALMMIVGGLAFFVRAKEDGSGHGLFGHCGGGHGGGCGTSSCGGGCGGGGCGGCGS